VVEQQLAEKSAVRSKLVQAGTELIAERGIDGVNTNVIARRAGVGVGTFYVHFEDKQALHRAAVMRGLEALQGELGRAIAESASGSIHQQVRAIVAAAVEFAESEPALFKIACAAKAPPAAKGQPAVGLSPRALETGLRELQAAGSVDPAIEPAIAARAFLGMQNTVLLWWLDEPERPPRQRVIETLTRLHPALQGPAAS